MSGSNAPDPPPGFGPDPPLPPPTPPTGSPPVATVQFGVLTGTPIATVQQWLTTAQGVYNQLMSGAKIVTASYTQGDGSKSVTYNMASIANLTAWIFQLQQALGMPGSRRRPLRPIYR